MTQEFLGQAGVARHLGLQPSTITAWWRARPGYLPAADATVDGKPVWRVETIDAWDERRRLSRDGARERKIT